MKKRQMGLEWEGKCFLNIRSYTKKKLKYYKLCGELENWKSAWVVQWVDSEGLYLYTQYIYYIYYCTIYICIAIHTWGLHEVGVCPAVSVCECCVFMSGCAEQVYNIYMYVCERVRVHLIYRHGTVVVELVLRPLPLRRAHLVFPCVARFNPYFSENPLHNYFQLHQQLFTSNR